MLNSPEQREAWLQRLIAAMRPTFAEHGGKIPVNIRVAPGFSGRRSVLGCCWPERVSKDGSFEIFVSPILDDPMRVAGVLAHELVHAAVGTEAGHKGPFRRLALAIGLTGKMTATQEGEAFKRAVAPILEVLGPYPHAELNPWKQLTVPKRIDGPGPLGGLKPQGTRLLKAMCPVHGYTVRVTRRWVHACGPPHCPLHGAMKIHWPNSDG